MKLDFPIKYSDALNEKMKNQYWKCNDNSHIDSSLRYFIVIPKNVKPVNLTEQNVQGSNKLKQIASYRRIDDAPYIEVQVVYERLEHELNPSDWQENVLDFSNEIIIDERRIKGNAGTYLDALTKREMPNGEIVISRTTSKKNFDPGNKRSNIVCVKVSCNIKDYPKLAEEMMAIATEWEFINKSDYQLSEDLSLLHMKDSNLGFYFPNSWKPSRIIVKQGFPERYALFNRIDETKALGAINLFLSNTFNNASEFFEEIVGRFDKEKITLDIGVLHEVEKDDLTNSLYFKLWVANGTLNEEGLPTTEIEVRVLELESTLILIESVSVSKENDQYNWARNKRALELAVNTLQIYKGKSNLT